MKMKFAKTVLIVLLSLMISWTYGQTLNDAGTAFNEGIKLSKEENTKGAIQAYENCIQICDQLGEEGNELKQKSQAQIVSIYTNLGTKSYKEKDPDQAIFYLLEAKKFAEEAGNKEGVSKANKYLGYAYTYKGNVELKGEKYENAINNFNSSLEYSPKSIKSYYGLGLAYLKTDDEPKMKEAMDKAISLGGPEDKTVLKAKSAAGKYYLGKSAKTLEKLQYDESIRLLNNSLEYISDNSDTYYYLCIAYNNTNAFDKAVAVGEQGLAIAGEEAFNLHFEVGRAYEGLGESKKACQHYKSVTGGPNVEAAKYQAGTVLKCK